MVAYHNLGRPDWKVTRALPPRSQLSQGPHLVSPKFMQVGCRAPNPSSSLRAEGPLSHQTEHSIIPQVPSPLGMGICQKHQINTAVHNSARRWLAYD